MFSASSPAKIVFLDRATLSPHTVLKPFPFPHVLQTFDRTAAHEIAARIGDADIVVTNKVRLDAATLADARRLRMIAIAATGTDIVDLDACAARRIVVSNIRGYAVRTVPEHTFALIFALRRSSSRTATRCVAGAGSTAAVLLFDHPIRDGRLDARDRRRRRARARGGRHRPRARHAGAVRGARRCGGDDYAPLDTLLRDSDVITLHCPLTPATRHLIDAAAFARMARRPLLINTARGGRG